MTKHTPGLENICGKEGCGFCPKCRALIAAAPELLEALKDLLELYGADAEKYGQWANARAAIAKGEGRLI